MGKNLIKQKAGPNILTHNKQENDILYIEHTTYNIRVAAGKSSSKKLINNKWQAENVAKKLQHRTIFCLDFDKITLYAAKNKQKLPACNFARSMRLSVE